MSSAVDNRLVKMTFDNDEFEKRVGTTLGTLDKLKQSLNFTGATKGLEDIQSSANNVNFNAIVDGLQALESRFSVVGEFVHNIFEGIINKIADVGRSLADFAIFTPIKDGFSEYELQMNSVQTIMASTGESVETVNGYLDELNKYADKTIYSFSDMTQNIGKFTNAGVSLDRAVEAIQGVSNVAAVSGANTNEASRAMYNFAQALSAGAVKLIDWKSIENANMATVEFKQSLIDTAVAMGTLVKDGDNYVSTTTDIRGKTSDAFNATQMFNESLSSQWMTTDVLVQTLSQYSTDVRDMGDEERAAYEEKLRSIGYTEDQIAAIEELGIKAADSAKDVKTFTQLIDTLKEALGSGWTKSWQYIIGDLEEAKALWTEISDVLGGYINKTADARNDTLRIWAENGGRVAVIDSLRNAFEALVSVLTPIKEAWDSAFPPVTAELLIKYSNKLKTFTESLKLTGDESNKLKTNMTNLFNSLKNIFDGLKNLGKTVYDVIKTITSGIKDAFGDTYISKIEMISSRFKAFTEAIKPSAENLEKLKTIVEGVFSVLRAIADIAVDAGSALFDALGSVFTSLAPYGQNFLDLLAQIGEWLKNFADALENSFNFEAFSNGFGSVAEAIKNFFEQLANFTHIDDIINKMKEFFAVGEGHEHSFDFLNVISGAFQSVLGTVSKYATDILNTIGGFISQIDLTKIDFFELLEKVFTVGAIKKVYDLISSIYEKFTKDQEEIPGMLTNLKKMVEDLVKKLTENLETIKNSLVDTFTTIQRSINANALLKIGIAIGVLVASLAVLSDIEPDKLATAMIALTGVMGEMAAFVWAMDAIDVKDGHKLSKIATGMVEMAGAVFILAKAVKDLAQLDSESLGRGLFAITTLIADMTAAVSVLNNTKFVDSPENLKKMGLALVEFAAAVKILASCVKDLGEIPADRLIPAMEAVTAIIVELGAVTLVLSNSKFVDKPKNLKKLGTGLIEFAAAVKIIAWSTKDLGEIPADRLIPAMEAVSAIIIELGAVTVVLGNSKFVNKPGNLKKIGLGLIEFAAVVKIISSVVKDLSEIESDKLGTAVGALTIIMVELGAVSAAFSADLINPGKIAAVSGALIVFSVAMGAMAVVMLALSQLDLPGLGIALAAIGGAILIFAGAAALLEPLIVPMYSLAGAMLVFGAGLALVGAGIGIASLGIATLLGTIVGLGPGAIDVLRQFIGLMGELGVGFGNMIVGLLTTLAENGPAIQESIRQLFEIMITAIAESTTFLVETILQVVLQIVTSLNETLPQIVELVLTLISSILTSIAEHLPEIMEAVMSIIITILTTIGEHIQEIVQAGIDIVLGFIAGITEKLPEIIDAAFKMIISFIDGLATAIEENHQALFEAIGHLIQAIVEAIIDGIVMLVSAAGDLIGAFIEAVGGFFNDIFSTGGELVGGLIDGFLDGLGGIAQAGVDLIGNLLESIGNFLSDLWDSGSDLVGNLIDGLLDGLRDIGDAAGDLGDELLDGINGFWSDIWDAGSDLVEGFINGLTSGISDVWNAACDLANEAWNAITSTLEINSPSRVAYGGGQNVDQGFINGMTSMIPDIKNASAATAYAAIASFDDTCSQLNDTAYTPTITPVIDSMEIQNGMIENFEARISFPDSISIKSKLDERLDFDQKIYNMLEVENDNILRSMSEISTRIELLQERLLDMGIYIDGQALVGAIAPDMDNALGQRSTYAQRGIFG